MFDAGESTVPHCDRSLNAIDVSGELHKTYNIY